MKVEKIEGRIVKLIISHISKNQFKKNAKQLSNLHKIFSNNSPFEEKCIYLVVVGVVVNI